jgi:hypothetical protein
MGNRSLFYAAWELTMATNQSTTAKHYSTIPYYVGTGFIDLRGYRGSITVYPVKGTLLFLCR